MKPDLMVKSENDKVRLIAHFVTYELRHISNERGMTMQALSTELPTILSLLKLLTNYIQIHVTSGCDISSQSMATEQNSQFQR